MAAARMTSPGQARHPLSKKTGFSRVSRTYSLSGKLARKGWPWLFRPAVRVNACSRPRYGLSGMSEPEMACAAGGE
jgi:hypothetical protein